MGESQVTWKAAGTGAIHRVISSVVLDITGEAAFSGALDQCARWAKRRNAALPQAAFLGEAFRIGGSGVVPAEGVRAQFGQFRAYGLNVDVLDEKVVGRTWNTEIVVAETLDGARFSAVLRNVTAGVEDPPFDRTVPGIVRQIIGKLAATKDGRPVATQPGTIGQAEVADLIAYLEDPDRRAPVLAVSTAMDGVQYVEAAAIATQITGVCHVVHLTPAASWDMTDRLGKVLSVFNGAARLYLPGFHRETAAPYDHPLWVAFHDGDPARRLSDLRNRVLSLGIRDDRAEAQPTFQALRQACAAEALAVSKQSGEAKYIALLEAEVAQQKAEIEALRSEQTQFFADWENELKGYEQDKATLQAESEQLSRDHENLKGRFQRLFDVAKEHVAEPLVDYAEFGAWAADNLSDKIWFAPKALKEMENAIFWKPDLIADALVVLDCFFIPMKLKPGKEARDAYVKRLEGASLSDQPCFGDPGTIKQFPEYRLTYTDGKTYLCADHLKYGGGLDPRKHFRIYYHWHESEGRLLIGHLPTHLDNKKTN